MGEEKIGVIGAGIMGRGVAQNFAQSGYEVVLLDNKNEVLESAQDEIQNNIRLHALLNKNSASGDIDAVVKRIAFTTEYARLKDVGFVVENIFEMLDAKKSVYEQIDQLCHKDCIFAANTSCVSITQLASYTRRPSKVIGIHFMNPVPLIPAVEVIRGYHTSEETIEKTRHILDTIGKQAIVISDLPGFVSNRISHLMMNEAAFIVQDQVAEPYEVDEIFKKCYGHKMGPLETADLIGLDTVKNSLNILYDSYQDPKFRCCPLIKKMVDAGLLGMKTGRGFYDYA